MYEEFYGLKEKPFNLTPDPKFLYLSNKHQEALELLVYGIAQKEGFILVTGDVGTGKTTICRVLLDKLNQKAAVALLLNPFYSEEELLRYVLKDFGVTPKGFTRLELLEELNQFLLQHAANGGVAVLIIDEAQNLSTEVLEQIRILSNLETDKEKLLQIVLVGQAELREKLRLVKLRQLDQRISVRYHLRPLDRKEVSKYVYHRLAVAGSGGQISFSRLALNRIGAISHGIPRLINLICDRTLLNGYSKQKYHLTSRMVVQAAKTLKDEEKTLKTFSFWRVSLVSLLGAIFLFLLGWTASNYPALQHVLSKPLKPALTKSEPRNNVVRKIVEPRENKTVLEENPGESSGVESYTIDNALPYTLHVGSFRTKKRALKEIQELKHLGHPLYIVRTNIPEKGIWYRVLLGKFRTKEEAMGVMNQLRDKEGLNYIKVMKAVAKGQEG